MQNLYARLAPYLVTIIEAVLVIATVALIFFSSRKAATPRQPVVFLRLERAAARLARRKRLSVVVVGLSVIAVRVALIPIIGVPQPYNHDEFSYLLAADTFAHGRLTNPTHPMWIHFESFHIIQKPTYMSMYPPAEGLVLAAGQLLGHPWIGQLLVTALMCSALCWMLQAWLPPAWAFFGAALAVVRLGILSYWMNGYWSASIVALAGALVLGAWPRLRKHLRVRDSLLMALGLVILANSRPYEGLLFAIPIAFAMLFWLLGKHHPAFAQSASRVIVPIFCSLLVGAIATGYYYYRVTGSPFRMAYQVNYATYGWTPYFLWQTPAHAVYRHQVMSDFYHLDFRDYERQLTVAGYLQSSATRAYSWWQFYLGPLLTLPLLAFPWVIHHKKMRLPLAICVVMIAGFTVQTWNSPHYFSPATGALYILLVQCMRQLWHWRRGSSVVAPALVRAIPLLACAMILLRVTAAAVHVQIEQAWPRGNLERARILHQLQSLPGKQLVIVAYGPYHDLAGEWVYNDADIDAAKVVWAHDMGDARNAELLSYFNGRSIWRVNDDASPPRLELFEAPHK
ncbi:MAG: hypothetical protein WAM04_15745 [Candidatus Sulfotelmatobacter sp.]